MVFREYVVNVLVFAPNLDIFEHGKNLNSLFGSQYFNSTVRFFCQIRDLSLVIYIKCDVQMFINEMVIHYEFNLDVYKNMRKILDTPNDQAWFFVHEKAYMHIVSTVLHLLILTRTIQTYLHIRNMHKTQSCILYLTRPGMTHCYMSVYIDFDRAQMPEWLCSCIF